MKKYYSLVLRRGFLIRCAILVYHILMLAARNWDQNKRSKLLSGCPFRDSDAALFICDTPGTSFGPFRATKILNFDDGSTFNRE